jgi:transposase
VGEAKTRTGAVEAIRALRVARRSAVYGPTTAINQMRALLVTGPADLRERLRGSTVAQLVTTATRLRPADPTTVAGATRLALRELARRVRRLEAECQRLEAVLQPLVATAVPDLVAARGVRTDTAGALLVAAGDNPQRLHSEAAFAHLCGVAPSTPPRASPPATASTAVAIAAPIRPSGGSSWSAWSLNPAPVPTWRAGPPRAAPNAR